jgi:alginate O-acetyltransferase complex protein AlgI
MLFNSFEFLIFFPLVVFIYFYLPYQHRWWWLLLASCIFYMFFIPVYILILLLTIIVDYWAGIKIEETTGAVRKRYLVISIVSTCLILAVFKYFNFLNDNVRALADLIGWNYPVETLKLILPIGLSFHTFQSLSYVIEVYRGNQKAERHFGIYSLYVMFFPQLVAGPIERPQQVLHQFYEKHDFDYKLATRGLKLMAWGLFKKLVIADRLSPIVNGVYNHPQDAHGWQIIIATLLFGIQIYCDFSGYSDIAIGSARVMGFRLMTNFDRPYLSKTISEFWKRWHISLSSWFRDYLYIPLGGNRVVKWRMYYNLILTFMVSGLWHGANWTFIIWGALHGVFLVVGATTKEYRHNFAAKIGLTRFPSFYNFLQIATTILLVCFAWIFFRANSLTEAKILINNMTDIHVSQLNWSMFGGHKYSLILGLLFIICLESIQILQEKVNIGEYIASRSTTTRWAIYIVFVTILINFGVFNSQGFIYFQF